MLDLKNGDQIFVKGKGGPYAFVRSQREKI
jgi:hypothetical protein